MKRTADGKMMVNGKKYAMLVGSRCHVWNGTAYKTGHGKAGLTKYLMMNKMATLLVKREALLQKERKI